MTDLEAIRNHVESNRTRFVEKVKEACSIPSVSAEGQGLAEMASWLDSELKSLGAVVTRLTVEGAADAILGEVSGSGDRSLLVYDHYDVQPVDPLDLWESPPFEPNERDGRIYVRGIADNKGDLVARLCALESYREVVGDLPFTTKFLIEGEEEIGSVNFDTICNENAGALSAQDCVWEGAGFDLQGRPNIYFGCKGLLYVELRRRMLTGDQHSSLAVIIPSAAWELLRAVDSLKDEKGRIAIEGFYDRVVGLGPKERELVERLPTDEQAQRLEMLGIESYIDGLLGTELTEQALTRPTANIAGFVTGYTVPGASKTVLPAEAMAKLDFRLVPDQTAADIAEKLKLHLSRNGFEQIEVLILGDENPSRSPVDSDLATAVLETTAEFFERPASVWPWSLGTGPMYPIAQGLGIPITHPAGVGRPDSNIHAPNESAPLQDFLDTIGYTTAYLARYGEAGNG
ncbi:MAG: M20/M25/M40 family metallo-hydrolase, partial [Actinomycetota bacterium]